MARYCENPDHEGESLLDVDHVTLVTTVHVRRFCTMECLVESFHLAREAAYRG